ncbi:MAG TPA: VCBS repeat-containing protein [Planctomycetota bacterium]
MRKWTLAALVLCAPVGVGVLVWLAGGPSPSPAPPPAKAAAPHPVVQKYADDVEDAVMEIEEALLDLATQIRRGALGGAMAHVAADFEGGALFREPGGEPRVVGGVEIRSAGPDPRTVDRAAFRASLAVAPDTLVFKLPAAKLENGALVGTLKADALRTRAGRAKRWVMQGASEFVKVDGRWRLRRFRGTEAKTEEGAVRFVDATVELGLALAPPEGAPDEGKQTFGRLFIGGLAAGDVDGDGDADLFVPRAGPDALFRNDGGRFTECAKEKGVDDPGAGAAALFLDVDNDGDLDLLVANYENDPAKRALALYRNDGAKFTDVTAAAGLGGARGPATTLCAADVDRDGDLDVYACYYHDDAKEDPRFSEEVPSDVFGAKDGEPNQLWINRGDGTFKEEAVARGVADKGWSLAAAFGDYDGDGEPDLCVANDYGEKRLFRNDGKGAFEDVTAAAGVVDTGFGMGVLWLDYDEDGDLDLYVSNMYSTAGNRILARSASALAAGRLDRLAKMARGNTLLRNEGNGTFKDVTPETGGGRAGWAWSAQAYDYDNDARLDIYVANGFRTSAYTTSDL